MVNKPGQYHQNWQISETLLSRPPLPFTRNASERAQNRFGDSLGEDVWEACNAVFDRMPLTAVIDRDIFCVHGGIPRPLEGSESRIQASEGRLSVSGTWHEARYLSRIRPGYRKPGSGVMKTFFLREAVTRAVRRTNKQLGIFTSFSSSLYGPWPMLPLPPATGQRRAETGHNVCSTGGGRVPTQRPRDLRVSAGRIGLPLVRPRKGRPCKWCIFRGNTQQIWSSAVLCPTCKVRWPA